MSKRKPSLKINAISNWVALGARIITMFFLTPFIISRLGRSGYGVWVLVSSFIGYYSFLELGIGSAVTRYIARFSGKNDKKKQNEVAATSMSMLCIAGMLVVIISFFAGEPLARFFEVEPEYINKFKWAIWLMGASIALSFPANAIDSTIIAYEKYILLNVIKIFNTILRAALIVLFLKLGEGILGLAYATLIMSLLHLIISRFLCRQIVPQVSFSLRNTSFWTSGTLMTYGGVSTIIMIASIVQASIGNFVTGKYLGAKYVAIFGISMLMTKYFRQFIIQATSVLKPRFALLEGASENRKLKILFFKATLNTSLLAFGLGAMIIIMGGRFIIFWVGEDFADAIPVLWLLVAGYSFAAAQNPSVALLYAFNKHKYYAIAMVVETSAIIGLSIVLAPLYGLIGIALGVAVPLLIIRSLQVIYVAKIANIKIYEYIKTIGLPFLISALTVLIAFFMGVITEYKEFSITNSVLYAVFFLVVISILSLFIPDSMTRSFCVRLIDRSMIAVKS